MSRRIQLNNVSKIYGKKKALEGASATWKEGTSVALIGSNGGGKSTLLKLLADVIAPDGGGIEGVESFSMAFMPDKLAFSRGWTATDWLSMVASWKKAPQSNVALVLKQAGLTDAAYKPVSTFSQGMLRRLLYAQTRLTDADLVLLDEPEGGLDPQWVVRLEDELDRLKSEGRTIVFSTHWLDLAVEKADQLLVFSQGQIVTNESSELWKPLDSPTRRHRLVELIGAGE